MISESISYPGYHRGIFGPVGRALACDALCRGFDPCRRRPRGVAVDFGPKQSDWLINLLGKPNFIIDMILTMIS
jgi:hypothetical protein